VGQAIGFDNFKIRPASSPSTSITHLSFVAWQLDFTMVPSRTSPKPPSTVHQGLSKDQLTTFERDGYLLIPDALSPDTVLAMLENFSLDDHPTTKFSTGEGTDGEHVGDDYFLTSGDKIRFFFEEGKLPSPISELDHSNGFLQMHSTRKVT
jgi:hypothetical protein